MAAVSANRALTAVHVVPGPKQRGSEMGKAGGAEEQDEEREQRLVGPAALSPAKVEDK